MYEKLKDEELVKLTAEGDDAAFSFIVGKYARKMYALSYRILHDKQAAEDAVQESFIKIWKNAPNWKKDLSSFSTWIYKIVTNTCIDSKRKYLRHAEQELDENYVVNLDDEHVEKEQLAKFLSKLIEQLPETQKICLLLFYKEELKQTEIATILSVSVKAVESNILRGKRKLHEILNERGIKLRDFGL